MTKLLPRLISLFVLTVCGCERWHAKQSLPHQTSPCKSESTTRIAINDGLTLTLPDSHAERELKLHSEHPDSGHVYLLCDQIMLSVAMATPSEPQHLFVQQYLSHSHDLKALSELGMNISISAKEVNEGIQRRSTGSFNTPFRYFRLRRSEDRFIMAKRGQKSLELDITDSQRYYSLLVGVSTEVDQRTCDAYLDSLECNLDVVFNSTTLHTEQESNFSK